MQRHQPLKVMVLAGGPDAERPVSLASGQQVAAALEQAGHHVLLRDAQPDDLSAIHEWVQWRGDVVFPVLHGPWGEGGPLQLILERKGIPFVGSGSAAAQRCMNKYETKTVLRQHGLNTPNFQRLTAARPLHLATPVVIKPVADGSSIGVAICRDQTQAHDAIQRLAQSHDDLLAESFVPGIELTVGVIASADGDHALPPIQIIARSEFYDYQAKYDRDDTLYRIGPDEIDLPSTLLTALQQHALRAHRVLGCRHLSRVDFIVDQSHQLWILELNTIPGFTAHSLLPKAATHAGVPMPALADRLVQLAHQADGP